LAARNAGIGAVEEPTQHGETEAVGESGFLFSGFLFAGWGA